MVTLWGLPRVQLAFYGTVVSPASSLRAPAYGVALGARVNMPRLRAVEAELDLKVKPRCLSEQFQYST